jgi:arsenate reductase (glutaredoxin)
MAKKETLIIYYNPRCGKCRTAKNALEEAGNNCEIIEYLNTPPDAKELKSILKKLGKKPLEVIRTKEPIFKELFAGKTLTDDQWIEAIEKYPILLERPIVVMGNKAWIARSPETLEEIM